MKADINDLFVLGRNLYQASGNAFSITNFFDDLHSNLSKYGKDVRRHLLNGMAYEIYFDNKAHLRRKFICNQLEDFEQKVFYVPGGEKIKITVVFNECFEEYGEEDEIYQLIIHMITVLKQMI